MTQTRGREASGARPPGAKSSSDLWARVLSALVLAPLAIGAVAAGGWLFVSFWTIAACGVAWEWQRMVMRDGDAPGQAGSFAALPLVVSVAALGCAAILVANGLPAWSAAAVGAGALVAAMSAPVGRRVWAGGGVVYAGIALIAPVMLRDDPRYGIVAVVFLFAVVWATDILGYVVGRAVGGPRLAPAVSPKKTWSGALGGLLGAAAAALSVSAWAELPGRAALVAVAMVLCVVSQAGDLFESAIKRRFDVKDSSHLIPGHGGLMDRLDGFVTAAGVAAILGIIHNGTQTPAKGLLVW